MTAPRDQRGKEAGPGRGEENGLGPRQALFRVTHCKKDKASPSQGHEKKFSPSNRIRTSDLWMSAMFPTTVHRSTN